MNLESFARTMLAAACATPVAASATNGYFSNGYGAASQGVAGVGIALPQDALAAAANPAGIAFVGDRFDVGISAFLPSRGANVAGNGYGVDGHYEGNNRSVFALPEAGIVKQLRPNLYAGIALYANGGLDTGYANNPFKAFGGKGSAGVDLEQVFLSPTLALRIGERHALGIGLNIAYQRFTASGLQPFASASVAPDNVTDRGADSSVGVGVHIGYTGRLTRSLTVGATWASKIRGRFDRYKGLFANGGSFDIPENFGFGLAYEITPAWTIAADFQRILYGNVDSVANPLDNLQAGHPLGSPNGPGFGWRNTNVLKIGTTYRYNPHLTLRLGYSHASQPIASTQTFLNVLAPGVVQDQATLGATWETADHAEFSFFYGHAFRKTVDGQASIPPSFGGGNANIRLDENIVGIAFGKKF
ncbi:outer membrane transport family protein [Burkholderia humptydooensis]|nr:outer membrane transport family protein [Burkholderia sp. 2002721687]